MRLKRNLQASLHPKRKSKTKCHQLMTGMKRLPRKKKTAKTETEEVEVEEAEEAVVEANSEAGEDLNVAEVKMVTAEMVKMGTVEMVKMDTVEVVVEAEAETGMETSETVNFVLAIAVENENLTVNEDLGEVNEVIEEVEVTGAAITINNRTEAMSKRMETKS